MKVSRQTLTRGPLLGDSNIASQLNSSHAEASRIVGRDPGVNRAGRTTVPVRGRNASLLLAAVWGCVCLGGTLPAFAAPCVQTDGQIVVSPSSDLDLETVFDCEGGQFEVLWSGEVTTQGTIYIGNGTTVNIYGESTTTTADNITSTSASASGDDEYFQELWSGLSDSLQLSSAVVASDDLTNGSIFVVDGGQLSLNALAVLNGNVNDGDGGGVHATDSNLTIIDCLFEENFASDTGGGVYAETSTLVVVNSTFRNNSAGLVPEIGESDVDGNGGGIASDNSAVFISGCLFVSNFAGKKGGGLLQEGGRMSLVGSFFYNNTAGGINDPDGEEDPIGEGGAMSLAECTESFDGSAACMVLDTSFYHNHVAKKGGAIITSGPDDAVNVSSVEFHRCEVVNNSAGAEVWDNPQGEGGAIVLGDRTMTLVTDCRFERNWAGKKGGVLNLSGGNDWEDEPGAVLVLRNSSFVSNTAALNNAGVVTMNTFTAVTVAGSGNIFADNECAQGGAVLGADYNTKITVEGGSFYGNKGDVETTEEVWQKGEQSGGVIWTRGELLISDGRFSGNGAENGGVVQAGEESTVLIEGGIFKNNQAKNGGVVYVISKSSLTVSGGVFEGNSVNNGGGAFFVEAGGNIEITGGNFTGNEADFGGFLYKEGDGIATCMESTVLLHNGVDGGAIYAVGSASLEWSCHLQNNSALVGPAIYARENTSVVLHDVVVSDNFVTRGSAIFINNGTLSTSKVVISDATDNAELSAVQTDELSTFKAEDTSFVGFAGETVIFSEGELYLDECDFSESSSTVLVYAGQENSTMIRNAWLGSKNYEAIAEEALEMLTLPSVETFINIALTCDSIPPPCSEGSWCIEGDLGVYCERYVLGSSLEEVCASGDVGALNLTIIDKPEFATYYPNLLEGALLLSLTSSNASADDSSIANTSRSCDVTGGSSRVVWDVSGLWSSTADSLDDWTVFPSTGLLLPGESITLLVVSKPSDASFNGFANVTFGANPISSSVAAASQSYSSESQTESGSVSFDVEYYFCGAGDVWNSSESETDADSAEACLLCTETLDGAQEGVDCLSPGATTKLLPIKPGYWRAEITSLTIHECLYEDACKGGTTIVSVDDYCAEGYKGPQCAVCETGYGMGVANECHACTAGFKGGMYFLLAVVLLVMIVAIALLVIYLVGGKDAVSSTVSSTKESALRMQHRGANLLNRSDFDKARPDFFDSSIGDTAVAGTSPTSGSRAGLRRSTVVDASRKGNDKSGSKRKQAPASRIITLLTAIPLSKLKIVIVVWQISSAFAEITKVPFPPIYEKFLSVIGIFSFDLGWILSAACLTSGIRFYHKLLIVTIGPLVPMCILGATFYLGLRPAKKSNERTVATGSSGTISSAEMAPGTAAVNETRGVGGRDEEEGKAESPSPAKNPRRGVAASGPSKIRSILRAESQDSSNPEKDRLWGLFARHTTILLIILYLVYTQISTVVFQTFACEDFSEISKSYLRADMLIECYTGEHTFYRVYATFMVFVYPLGIPAVFLYFLVRQRSRINPSTSEDSKKAEGGHQLVEQQMEARQKDQRIAPTSFLWNAYLPKCYYYEVFECIRRLLLTGLLVFLVPDTAGQVAFSCVFAIVSLMVFEILRPHVNPVDMQLYRTGCLVILFTNFLALVIKAGVASEDSSGSAAYSIVLVVVNVLFFLSIWSNAWVTAKATFSRSHAQDMMFGVDVVDESTFDKLLGPSKKSQESLGQSGQIGGDVKTEDSEMRPLWDAGPTSSWHSTSTGNSKGGTSASSSAATTVPRKLPAFGGNVLSALTNGSAASRAVSASDEPVRRVSYDERLSADGRLVPLAQMAEREPPTGNPVPGVQAKSPRTEDEPTQPTRQDGLEKNETLEAK